MEPSLDEKDVVSSSAEKKKKTAMVKIEEMME
jgi:hypothetical protein